MYFTTHSLIKLHPFPQFVGQTMPKSMETMLIEHTSTAGHGETLVGFAGGGCSR